MGTSSVTSKQYTYTHEGRQQKFGEVQYVFDETNPQFRGIRVHFDASSVQQTSQQWQKVIQYLSCEEEIKDLIVLPVSYYWSSEGGICNYENQRKNTYEVIYNRFFSTLASELQLRIEKKIHFSEAEVWYLGYIILKVSSFFENHSWHLGNIHPKNIMIDKEGTVKIFTTFSSPTERQNYEQVKQSKYNDAYLAPQETSAASSQKSQKAINKNKIDAFYIGLIMLSLTCLKDLYFVFDHSQSSIKWEALGELLLKLKRSRDKYSLALYSIIENMLDDDPEERSTPLDYYQILKKYEKDITQMNGIDFSKAQMADFKFNHNKKYRQKRKYQVKEITFLTLSKKYQQQAFKTKQKQSKFISETHTKTNHKLF